jgi:16S rRNA C967 or C1407 C5-methylase (RsmB/RsmF family)
MRKLAAPHTPSRRGNYGFRLLKPVKTMLYSHSSIEELHNELVCQAICNL